MPLRPIVSSIGAVTYEISKELARILKLLGGISPYQVQNIRDFIQQIKGIHLRSDEIIRSNDVKAPFTSVPIQPALTIIKKKHLEEDKRTPAENIYDSESHHLSTGVLLEEYLLHIPGKIL